MAEDKIEKTKAIDLALSQIEKQFGKGSIMRLGNKEAIVPISVISTGSISFDAALGVGGVPRGPGPRANARSRGRRRAADQGCPRESHPRDPRAVERSISRRRPR